MDMMDNELEHQETIISDEKAFNDIGLTDKQIEPSTTITKFVTRNQSLGNLDGKEFKEAKIVKDEALSLLTIPYEIGGWLSKFFGVNLLSRNELTFVMSGSKEGYNRELLATRKAVITRENKNKTKRGIGDGIGN